MRSVNANGHLLFLTPDSEDRYTRFDMDTGPGQGSVYAAAQYNGLGARFVRRSADGATHGMAYDGVSPGDALLYDGAGAIAYTPGIAQTSYASGKTLYTNVDALGSVHDTQTDGSGGPADVLRTEAFGTTLTASSEPDALSLGWGASSSYQTDSDTGLTLLGNRYYDPSVGRFLSPDPAGAGDNWYAYCGNDPLGGLDPDGLDPQSDSNGGLPPDAFGTGTTVTYLGGTFLDEYFLIHLSTGSVSYSSSTGGASGGTLSGLWDTFSQGVDGFATFGLAGRAGTAWGEVDSHRGSVGKAVGLTLGLGVAVAASAASGGEDAVGVNISEKGLAMVEEHIGTFEEFAPNTAMLYRLRNILNSGGRAAGADANFYLHELSEATSMKNGLGYDAAHAAALSKYGVSNFSLYHPDVIQEFAQEFNPNWRSFWGL